MGSNGANHVISTLAELEALFPDEVYPPARVKETDRITKAYQALIEASPFFANVLPDKSELTVDQGKEVTQFQLTFGYTRPDTAIIHRVPLSLSVK